MVGLRYTADMPMRLIVVDAHPELLLALEWWRGVYASSRGR